MTCQCAQEVDVYRNRDKTLLFTIYGPGDLTDAKVWFSVKEEMADPDSEALITKLTLNNGGGDDEIQITDPYIKETDPESRYYNKMVSKIAVYIVPGDTLDIEPGDYLFDLVVQTAAGKKYQVVVPSRFCVKQPTTMALVAD